MKNGVSELVIHDGDRMRCGTMNRKIVPKGRADDELVFDDKFDTEAEDSVVQS